MLKGSKLAAVTRRLSVVVKLTSHLRKYPTSIDTRGRISCCTEAPMPQSPDRTPHPCSTAGSIVLLKTGLPKFWSLSAAQKSPPLATRFCSPGFSRSQSGAKLLFASVQVRVTVVEMRVTGFEAE